QENNKHILFWTTAAEEQTAFFGIERSADAVHFKSIGTVPATGNQDSRMQYRFTDEHPLPKNNYYRLKMMDLDGEFTYSPVILLKRYVSGVGIAVFPNPTVQSVNIIMQKTNAETTGYAQLTDINGKVLQQKQWGANDRMNVTFNLDAYSSGIYLIRMMIDGELSVWKVMKQ
ncbi:MAG: T9SS type A sorting domain-containing protein, partial [Bacteroidota bacterium]